MYTYVASLSVAFCDLAFDNYYDDLMWFDQFNVVTGLDVLMKRVVVKSLEITLTIQTSLIHHYAHKLP